jgi:hypothetical protein
MRNTLLCSSILTAVLCGPALADSPAKPTGPPAADPSQMLRITLVVKAGADARTYELSISDRGCGSLSDKSAAHEDEIRVCSRPAAAGFLIDTDWKTRAGAVEYRTRSEMLVARGGGSGEVGRTGGLRLGVTVR